MPSFVGVVIDDPNPPGQREALRVILTVGRERVVEVTAFLEPPFPSLVPQAHTGERDEVHRPRLDGAAGCRRGLEENHLQQA